MWHKNLLVQGKREKVPCAKGLLEGLLRASHHTRQKWAGCLSGLWLDGVFTTDLTLSLNFEFCTSSHVE